MSRLQQKKILSKIVFTILGLMVFLFSYQLGNRYTQSKPQETNAFLLPKVIGLTPLTLVNEEGAPFEIGDFKNYWTLVIVGDHQDAICKQLLTRYVLAWNRLAHDKPLQNMTRVAFLSLAVTDYPASELKSFIEFAHPDFVALTGDQEKLRQFTSQLGMPAGAYQERELCSRQNSIVALINPDTRLIAFFTGISEPATIAHDLEIIASK